MTRRVRIKGIRREDIDEDKLALAFLLLAREIHHQAGVDDNCRENGDGEDETAADGKASA